MQNVPRRNVLKSLLAVGPAASIPFLTPVGQSATAATSGTLNLHVSGPFLFLHFPTRVLILAPNPADHLAPYFTTLSSESDIDLKGVYELVGPSTETTQPLPYPIGTIAAQRLNIQAATLKLDQMGTLDPGHIRYFALWVPTPGMMAPWHPVDVNVSGQGSPFGPASTQRYFPVGYTLIYDNVTFATVQINNLADSSKTWSPNLTPLPYQSVVDIYLPMEPSLKVDECHVSALAAFGNELDLLAGVNQFPKLDLKIHYNSDPASCSTEMSRHKSKEEHSNREKSRTHPGHDCKAPIVEIDNVSDKVKLG
jgi:hypothetical protein